MRHQVHGKKLNRSSGHRKALYRNLVQSLVEHERITTTLVKAKAIRPVFEQLVTRAGKQDLASRRAVVAFLPTQAAADKMYTVLGPRFAERPGGYTRIIKLGRRQGDNTEMAMIELVEQSAPAKTSDKRQATSDKKTAVKKSDPSSEPVEATATKPAKAPKAPTKTKPVARRSSPATAEGRTKAAGRGK